MLKRRLEKEVAIENNKYILNSIYRTIDNHNEIIELTLINSFKFSPSINSLE